MYSIFTKIVDIPFWTTIYASEDKTHSFSESSNSFVTWDMIKKNPEQWDASGVSHNPNITINIIKNNPRFPWDWYWVSSNKNVTWRVVLNNPDIAWSYTGLSFNRNISWFIILNNLNKQWSWNNLSDEASFGIIRAYPEIPWNWKKISRWNFRIRRRHIENFPEFPWDYKKLTERKYFRDDDDILPRFIHEISDYIQFTFWRMYKSSRKWI